MRIFHGAEQAVGLEACALALGNFDGVHLGHQALFERAAQLGRPVVLTFHPHPGKVLQPDLAPKLITTLSRKLELLEDCGIEAVILQSFTAEYAKTSATDFERALFDQIQARHAVVGPDFTYGAGRQGSVAQLRAAALARSAEVQVMEAVALSGVVVSSSKIREYILEGRVSAARRLLGRYFDLDGVVVSGQGRGRSIGFPTANVDTSNELRPAPGVYAVRVRLLEGATRPVAWLPGAANIGVKPTFGGTEVTIEVHLLDFSGELYGRELRVQFLDHLRAEQRFHSAAELAVQIRRDVEVVRTIIARMVE
jgi:riboflavin kinase / FMN adenylyltransferase